MINDERLLINDGVHTENTEENGGLQADSFGERQLENEKCPRRTRRNTEGGPQADDGKKCETSEFKRNLNGGPQADDGGERKLKRIIRDLKKKIYIHRCHRWSQIDVRKRTGDLGE